MNIRTRFQIFFTLYILAIIVIVSIISLLHLQDTYTQFIESPNRELIPIMADKMLFKTALNMGVIIIIVIAISIPVGILLFKLISNKYLKIFDEIKTEAEKRLNIEENGNVKRDEKQILLKYIDLMIQDQQKLRDYEKMKSWKDGVRILMHELKNPLTPLKLSSQNISLKSDANYEFGNDLSSIELAVKDIENIMARFRELINLEFGEKELINFFPLFDEVFTQMKSSYNDFKINNNLEMTDAILLSEPVLLKMVISNLVLNGLEANQDEFYIDLYQDKDEIHVKFVTPNRMIKNPAKLFRPGASEKGDNRGYGLFLSKLISEYLNLGLNFDNTQEGVVFSICLKPINQESEAKVWE
ncbi:hypothetical protein ACFLQT_00085 [Bacteroidota bacterium]